MTDATAALIIHSNILLTSLAIAGKLITFLVFHGTRAGGGHQVPASDCSSDSRTQTKVDRWAGQEASGLPIWMTEKVCGSAGFQQRGPSSGRLFLLFGCHSWQLSLGSIYSLFQQFYNPFVKFSKESLSAYAKQNQLSSLQLNPNSSDTVFGIRKGTSNKLSTKGEPNTDDMNWWGLKASRMLGVSEDGVLKVHSTQ